MDHQSVPQRCQHRGSHLGTRLRTHWMDRFSDDIRVRRLASAVANFRLGPETVLLSGMAKSWPAGGLPLPGHAETPWKNFSNAQSGDDIRITGCCDVDRIAASAVGCDYDRFRLALAPDPRGDSVGNRIIFRNRRRLATGSIQSESRQFRKGARYWIVAFHTTSQLLRGFPRLVGAVLRCSVSQWSLVDSDRSSRDVVVSDANLRGHAAGENTEKNKATIRRLHFPNKRVFPRAARDLTRILTGQTAVKTASRSTTSSASEPVSTAPRFQFESKSRQHSEESTVKRQGTWLLKTSLPDTVVDNGISFSDPARPTAG